MLSVFFVLFVLFVWDRGLCVLMLRLLVLYVCACVAYSCSLLFALDCVHVLAYVCLV